MNRLGFVLGIFVFGLCANSAFCYEFPKNEWRDSPAEAFLKPFEQKFDTAEGKDFLSQMLLRKANAYGRLFTRIDTRGEVLASHFPEIVLGDTDLVIFMVGAHHAFKFYDLLSHKMNFLFQTEFLPHLWCFFLGQGYNPAFQIQPRKFDSKLPTALFYGDIHPIAQPFQGFPEKVILDRLGVKRILVVGEFLDLGEHSLSALLGLYERNQNWFGSYKLLYEYLKNLTLKNMDVLLFGIGDDNPNDLNEAASGSLVPDSPEYQLCDKIISR